MIETVVERWHQHLRGRLPGGLDELLADDVVFYSPVVYTPQQGKAVTKLPRGSPARRCPARLPRPARPPRAGASGTRNR
jgi:hypothetical protein